MDIFTRCRAMRREAVCLRRQMERMRGTMTSVQSTLQAMPGGSGSHHDRMAAYMADMDTLEHELLDRAAQYVVDLATAEELLRGLPLTEELVMREYYINGLTNEQVAETLDISDRHVRRAKSAARRRMNL